MPLTCSKCSRVNPTDAQYCYFDGMVLLAHAAQSGPLNMGVQPFPTPFVFPAGRVCRNFDQLALACQEEWASALTLIQNGDLANFLGSIGRSDLARIARECTRAPNRDRGLDAFLAKLPSGVLLPPTLFVEPRDLNLGELRISEDRKVNLVLSNRGMRLLYGTITCKDVWLSLGDSAGTQQKLFQFEHEWNLPIFVRGKRLSANPKPLEAELVIESNGGAVSVMVRTTVRVKPFPEGALAGAVSPRQLAEKAKEQPKQAAIFFENGAVARWYAENGWHYPVQGPSSTGLGAIQQYYEAHGLARAPKVDISQMQVSLTGKAGEFLRHQIDVYTAENRSVYAIASSNQSWLEIEPTPPRGRSAPVILVVRSVPDRPGETLQARVSVRANGDQRFNVGVTLTIAAGQRLTQNQPPIPLQAASSAVASLAASPADGTASLPRAIPIGSSASIDQQEKTKSSWPLHLLPACVLLLLLGVMFFRDTRLSPARVTTDDTELVDPNPRIALRLHDQVRLKEHRDFDLITMRFGLVMLNEKDPLNPQRNKRLTYDEWGVTNNTCIKLDGEEYLYGIPPGQWKEQKTPLGNDPHGRTRDGFSSIWDTDFKKVFVTQTVEIVPGQTTHVLDTCLIRYQLENKDQNGHQVGLRFMLDTFIGANDGVPFTLPGLKGNSLCNTMYDFNRPEEVPDFIQALENEDLSRPGTVAQVQFRLGGRFEPPERVTLGAWPNDVLSSIDPRCRNLSTRWEVPVLSMQEITRIRKGLPRLKRYPPDSAVVLYWPVRELKPGEKRELGFAYGLGSVASSEGKIGITVAGSFKPGGEFTVTAYVSNPTANQTLTLQVPEGLLIKEGNPEQPVPPARDDVGSRNSTVTWKVQSNRTGKYMLKVLSNTGAAQTQSVVIKERGVFD